MRESAALFRGLLLAACFLPLVVNSTTVDVDLQSSADGSSWDPASAGVVASDGSPVYYRATMTPAGGVETVTNTLLVDRPAGSPAHVRLESSPDLSDWSMILPGNFDVTGAKLFFRVQEDDTFGEFVLVEGGTINVAGVDVTTSDFHIGRFEVTQELWDDVYNWALGNGYDFTNNSGGNWNASGCVKAAHPINNVSWHDAVKWCNARSEREGLTEVYYTDDLFTTPYKSGVVQPLLVYVKSDADGYRLPSRDEWPYAAHGGQASQDYTYSGSDTADEVARYVDTSYGSECPIFNTAGYPGTWPAGSLLANELGIFDMSGNVKEWLNEGPAASNNRYLSGGAYLSSLSGVAITYGAGNSAATTANGEIGLRLARNAPVQLQAAGGDSVSPSLAGKGKRNDASRAKAKPGQLK